jgi:Zn-finger nucleic acid-binding protein
MAERAPRYPCPVCLGVTMEKVRVRGDAPVEIDHCRRCGGAWFELGEVPRLRMQPAAALWNRIARREEEVAPPCHDCHAPLPRELPECRACGWKNVLDCPVCERPMHRESCAGVQLDVCRSCKGVWFDHAELDTIWTQQAAMALERRPAAASLAESTGETAGGVLLEVLFWAPDLVFHGAYAAAHVASGVARAVPELAAAAPEATVAVVEAAGEAAGGVFKAIVGILDGIFGGLG